MKNVLPNAARLALPARLARLPVWLLAVAPAAAAFLWVSLASRMPEPIAQRRALGECAPQWDFAALARFEGEPACLLGRGAQLLLLQLPGMSIAATAVANAVLAVLLAAALCLLVRRAASTAGSLTAAAFCGAALFACSPEYGANWLHGERLGRFAVPLLFVLALLAAGPARAGGGARLSAVVLLAAAAPLFDDRGAVVFVALLPALAGRPLPWLLAMLLAGNVAAAYVLGPALAPAGHGFAASALRDPLAALDALLRTTGGFWPDALPGREWDERALGALSWCLPLAALLRGGARGPWWCCVAFGLLSALWLLERRGALAGQALAEARYGGFLLPVGAIGLLASRCGRNVWAVAAAVLLVPLAQGWERGLDALRLARSRVDRVDAHLTMPFEIGGLRDQRELPTRDLAELLRLEQRGWLPDDSDGWFARIAAAVERQPDPSRGTFAGGSMGELHGTVRSRLFGPQVSCVLVGATFDGELVSFAHALPEARDAAAAEVAWRVSLRGPVPAGARVLAVGVDARTGEGFRLGPVFALRGGRLVEVDR